MAEYTVVPAQDLSRILASGAPILDVRTAAEHAAKHLLAPHDLVTLDHLSAEDYMLRHGLDRDDAIYMLCRSGVRARKAAEQFLVAGCSHIYVIDGGILACEKAGAAIGGAGEAPAAVADKMLPLAGQMRIALGGTILLGLLLSLAHPVFWLVPVGICLGLIRAGVTGDTRFEQLFMKAPWNKNLAAKTPAACGLPKTPSKPTAGGCA